MGPHAILALALAVLLPLSVLAQETREISPYIDIVFCPAKSQPWSCARQQSGRILNLWSDQLDSEWQKLKVEADQQFNATLERRGYSHSETLTKEKPSTLLKKIELGTNYMKDYLSYTFDGFLGREYYSDVERDEGDAFSDEFVDVEGELKKGSKKKKKKKKKKRKKKKKKGNKGDSEEYYEGHVQQVTPSSIFLLQSPVEHTHKPQKWHEEEDEEPEARPQQVLVLQGATTTDDNHGGHGGKKKRKRRKKKKKKKGSKKRKQSMLTAIPAFLGVSDQHDYEEDSYEYEQDHSVVSLLGSFVGDFLDAAEDYDDDDDHGYVVVKGKGRKKKRKRKRKKIKRPIKYVTRGKKKKKRKALMKLALLGGFLKAKIELLLKILGTHLQIKFLAIAAVGLLINVARFWIDLKRGGGAPQKVVYVEHAHHQHHYEDHGEDWGGEQGSSGSYWKRSIQTDPAPLPEHTSDNIGYYPHYQSSNDPNYMAYHSQLPSYK